MNNKTNERHASRIDTIHIEYKCIYDKNVCPHTHHRHGSCRSLENRRTHRSSHCDGDKKNGISGYFLVVDDKTEKRCD